MTTVPARAGQTNGKGEVTANRVTEVEFECLASASGGCDFSYGIRAFM
jgi:hypothetical protein